MNQQLPDPEGFLPFVPVAMAAAQDMIDAGILHFSIDPNDKSKHTPVTHPEVVSRLSNITKDIYNGFLFKINAHRSPEPIQPSTESQ